jgi:mono/diheme cytochrome c family protein
MKIYGKKLRAWFCAAAMVFLLFAGNNLMAHGWVAPQKEAKVVNPIAMDGSSIDRGRETFLQFCAYCHGQNAQGQTAAEANLHEGPPNLVEMLPHHSEGDFHWKIRNGKEEMPSFKDVLSDREIWDIINFIKSRK